MESLKKAFTDVNMSWKKVMLLSVVCGVVPGLLMLPDFLYETSFQQPGISYEFWIFMALLIAVNSGKPAEAGLKTFVFFLVSQPLIYLVQVPFSAKHWQLFSYYPKWALITVLTLPGGMLAWRAKKGDWLSVIILSLANVILCMELPESGHILIKRFPRYLVSTLFMAAEIVSFVLLLIKKRALRAAAFLTALILLLLGSYLEWSRTTAHEGRYSFPVEGTAPFEIVSEYDGIEFEVDGNELTVTTEGYISCPIRIIDADGNEYTVYFTSNAGGASWQQETGNTEGQDAGAGRDRSGG